MPPPGSWGRGHRKNTQKCVSAEGDGEDGPADMSTADRLTHPSGRGLRKKKGGKIPLMVGFLHKSALASSDHSAHCAAGQLEVIQTGSERTRISDGKIGRQKHDHRISIRIRVNRFFFFSLFKYGFV